MHYAIIYGFHMTGNTDMHLLVTDTLKESRGVWSDHNLPYAERHISFA